MFTNYIYKLYAGLALHVVFLNKFNLIEFKKNRKPLRSTRGLSFECTYKNAIGIFYILFFS